MKSTQSEISTLKMESETPNKKTTELGTKELKRGERLLTTVVFFIITVATLIGVLILSNYVKDKLIDRVPLSGSGTGPSISGTSPNITSTGSSIAAADPNIADPNTTTQMEDIQHNDSTQQIVAYIISAALAGICIFFSFYYAILILKDIISQNEPRFLLIPGLLANLKIHISLIGTLITLNLLAPYPLYYNCITGPKFNLLFSITEWKKEDVSSSCFWLYNRLLPGLFKIVGLIFIKDIIIYMLNLNIHYKYYKDRIASSADKITVLREMVNITNAIHTDDMDVIIQQFMKIVGEKGPITITTLKGFFTEEIAHKIMNYCAAENELTGEDIKKFFETALLEKNHIANSIEHGNKTVNNFESIVWAILIPLILYQLLSMLQGSNNKAGGLADNAYIVGTMVFSTNYTFSDSLKSFAASLVFVFFIRPFEMGDLIIVDGGVFKVHEINLLTTVLFDGQEYSIFINSELCKKTIKNLRLNGVWEVKYSLKLKIGDLRAQYKALVSNVSAYVDSRTSEFKKGVFISNIDLKDDGKTETSLSVKLNCNVDSVETLIKRRTALFFKIQEILEKLPA